MSGSSVLTVNVGVSSRVSVGPSIAAVGPFGCMYTVTGADGCDRLPASSFVIAVNTCVPVARSAIS